MFNSLRPHELQHAMFPCPPPSPKLMSFEPAMPSNHLTFCYPFALLHLNPFIHCTLLLLFMPFPLQLLAPVQTPGLTGQIILILPLNSLLTTTENDFIFTKFLEYLLTQSLKNMYMFNNRPVLCMGSPCGSAGKESTCNAGDLGSIPGLGRSPGEGMSTHSRILAWKIPWTV